MALGCTDLAKRTTPPWQARKNRGLQVRIEMAPAVPVNPAFRQVLNERTVVADQINEPKRARRLPHWDWQRDWLALDNRTWTASGAGVKALAAEDDAHRINLF